MINQRKDRPMNTCRMRSKTARRHDWFGRLGLLSLLSLCSACGGDGHDDRGQRDFVVGMLVQQDDVGDTQKELGAGLLAMRQINEAGGLTIGGVDYRMTLRAE